MLNTGSIFYYSLPYLPDICWSLLKHSVWTILTLHSVQNMNISNWIIIIKTPRKCFWNSFYVSRNTLFYYYRLHFLFVHLIQCITIFQYFFFDFIQLRHTHVLFSVLKLSFRSFWKQTFSFSVLRTKS